MGLIICEYVANGQDELHVVGFSHHVTGDFGVEFEAADTATPQWNVFLDGSRCVMAGLG